MIFGARNLTVDVRISHVSPEGTRYLLFKMPAGLIDREAVDCNMLRPAGDDQYLCDEKIA